MPRPPQAEAATVSAAIARGPGWAILHDTSLVSDPEPGLFDPAHWEGRVAGRAERGRGNLLFVDVGARQWAVRHYRRGGLAGRLLADRFMWCGEALTRSFREWRMLARLHEAGMPVPRPVAAGWRRRGLLYVADLATERIPAAIPLSARIGAGQDVDWRAIGGVVRQFHEAGACHADLNAHNILLDHAGKVWLLDFDRGRFRAPGPWQRASLDRLERSLRKIAAAGVGQAFDAAGWAELRAGYGAGLDLRRRASGP
jgi:3-deoxy-D-manno-octulosonic acid kinase